MKVVKLSDIRIDGGTQIRKNMNPKWVSEIVENMKSDVEYPPLEAVYDNEHYWLTDGFHRYYALKQLGIKEFRVEWFPGTLEDAIRRALSANSTHGLYRTRDDKVNAVLTARDLPEYKEASFYEIAKICAVSQPFVAAVLNPKAKEKQQAARDKNAAKTVEAKNSSTNPISTSEPAVESPTEGVEPSEEELAADAAAFQADVENMQRFLQADDKLAEQNKIIEAQTLRIAQLELRLKGLMNEKNELIKLLKTANSKIDKLQGK